MPLIEIKDLTKSYDSDLPDGKAGGVATRALDHVSLNIEKSEFVAIMGPSGSGKSTLLHILGFLDNPTSGEYLLDGKLSTDYSKEEVAKVRNKKFGFIFQSFNLLRRTSVLDNIKLPLLYSDIPEHLWNDLAKEALERVGLTHRLHHQPSQLSGGEQQRAAIARALVNKPEIIFADEPTGNLDSKSGKIVMETIQKLNEEKGITIILITHETYTAEHAQRIITLKDGQIESDRKVVKRKSADKFIK
ncbi:MAG: ABC transporter ATP-binding protein [Parcubacteria group bacterium]